MKDQIPTLILLLWTASGKSMLHPMYPLWVQYPWVFQEYPKRKHLVVGLGTGADFLLYKY